MKLAALTIATGITLGLVAAQVEAGPITEVRYSATNQAGAFDFGDRRVGMYWSEMYRITDTDTERVLNSRLYVIGQGNYATVPFPQAGTQYQLGDYTLSIESMIGNFLEKVGDEFTPVSVTWHISGPYQGGLNAITTTKTTHLAVDERRYWVSSPGTAALLSIGLAALWRARK